MYAHIVCVCVCVSSAEQPTDAKKPRMSLLVSKSRHACAPLIRVFAHYVCLVFFTLPQQNVDRAKLGLIPSSSPPSMPSASTAAPVSIVPVTSIAISKAASSSDTSKKASKPATSAKEPATPSKPTRGALLLANANTRRHVVP